MRETSRFLHTRIYITGRHPYSESTDSTAQSLQLRLGHSEKILWSKVIALYWLPIQASNWVD